MCRSPTSCPRWCTFAKSPPLAVLVVKAVLAEYKVEVHHQPHPQFATVREPEGLGRDVEPYAGTRVVLITRSFADRNRTCHPTEVGPRIVHEGWVCVSLVRPEPRRTRCPRRRRASSTRSLRSLLPTAPWGRVR